MHLPRLPRVPRFSRRARGIALAVLASAVSLLALYAVYAPLVRSHGPADPFARGQFAAIANRDSFHLYPLDCVM